MVGDFSNNEKKGIIPRLFDEIFEKINQLLVEDNINYTYNINIAFIQLYLEIIQDLFEPNNNVKIREDPEKGVFLKGVEWIKVKSTNQCAEAFISGEKNCDTSFTKMNAHSSRSHALLIVKNDKDNY